MTERIDDGELSREELQQHELSGDLDVIAGFGDSIPEHWAGLHLDNRPDPVRVVMCVSDAPASHEAELVPRLAYPERLQVLVIEMMSSAPEMAIAGVGIDVEANTVTIGLARSHDDRAHELRALYGNRVVIETGVVYRTR